MLLIFVEIVGKSVQDKGVSFTRVEAMWQAQALVKHMKKIK